MVLQTKRKGFNAAEARVADTGAAQFFDPKRGLPKAEAGVLSTPRPGKKAVRYPKTLMFLITIDMGSSPPHMC